MSPMPITATFTTITIGVRLAPRRVCVGSSASPDLGPVPATSLRVVETRAPSGLFPSGPPRPDVPGAASGPGRGGARRRGGRRGVAAARRAARHDRPGRTSGSRWPRSGSAWAVAVLLLRFGDRGVATGVASAPAFGAAIAVGLVVVRWVTVGWPLW